MLEQSFTSTWFQCSCVYLLIVPFPLHALPASHWQGVMATRTMPQANQQHLRGPSDVQQWITPNHLRYLGSTSLLNSMVELHSRSGMDPPLTDWHLALGQTFRAFPQYQLIAFQSIIWIPYPRRCFTIETMMPKCESGVS